jgi:hypothetical protein
MIFSICPSDPTPTRLSCLRFSLHESTIALLQHLQGFVRRHRRIRRGAHLPTSTWWLGCGMFKASAPDLEKEQCVYTIYIYIIIIYTRSIYQRLTHLTGLWSQAFWEQLLLGEQVTTYCTSSSEAWVICSMVPFCSYPKGMFSYLFNLSKFDLIKFQDP